MVDAYSYMSLFELMAAWLLMSFICLLIIVAGVAGCVGMGVDWVVFLFENHGTLKGVIPSFLFFLRTPHLLETIKQTKGHL